ncbi:MAG: hypothetical protein GC162_04225 [Planctomycetes bacterium]|nr:hypothetical protein [Planctomycetota bacterium]
MTAINLIPTYRIVSRQRRKRLRGWVTALTVYTLLLLLACAAARVVWGQSDRALSGEVADLEATIKKTNADLAALKPQLAEAQLQLEASLAVAVQPDWSVMLALLGKERGQSVVLDRISIKPVEPVKPVATAPENGRLGAAVSAAPEGSSKKDKEKDTRKPMNFAVEITGLGREQTDVSQFVLRLEQTGLFRRVQLLDTARYPFGQGMAVSFHLMCSMGDGEATP